MIRRSLIGTVLISVLSAGPASAQEPLNAARKVDIYYFLAGFVRTGGSSPAGGCLAVGVTLTHAVGIVGETCSTHQFVGETPVDSLGSYRAGVRLSRRMGNRVTTFVQSLAGIETGYRHTGHADDAGFSFDAGGGVDVGLKNWFGLRIVEAKYQMARLDGAVVNGVRFGAGVVFRFGKRKR